MAGITVEQYALNDPRFGILAKRLKFKKREAAIGIMLPIWMDCLLRETCFLTEDQIAAHHPDLKNLTNALIESNLAKRNGRGKIYLRGTRDRIGWLKECRRAGREQGWKGAEHGIKGGRPKNNPLLEQS